MHDHAQLCTGALSSHTDIFVEQELRTTNPETRRIALAEPDARINQCKLCEVERHRESRKQSDVHDVHELPYS